ncbi:hypothetical protein H072_9103 [Dactylellina haptotyla CBS 200.50]|uniref:Uncharacterized protein n=1 Tax=Dactylellina haptotyla (strain CBS 200.50) TaxID=1284197 RepID=S8BDK9_DACHA|nr:hypothetical protein H072_9103 [Dactylellina haptotyla CBS 200.50]
MTDIKSPIELVFEPDTELADRDEQPFSVQLIRESKVTTTATCVRYGRYRGKKACLVVLRCNFIPAYQVRFKYAEIELRIVRGDGSSILAYYPHAWEGKASILPVQQTPMVGAAHANLDAEYERHSERTGIKKARILSVLEESTVEWRLSENDVTREGVPNPFRAALIVETDGIFSIRLKYEVNLSRSADPRSWRSAYARLTQPLDLSETSVGGGIGPAVAGIEEMEKSSFDLSQLSLNNLDKGRVIYEHQPIRENRQAYSASDHRNIL